MVVRLEIYEHEMAEKERGAIVHKHTHMGGFATRVPRGGRLHFIRKFPSRVPPEQ